MSLKKSLVITAGLLASFTSFTSAASNVSLAFNNDNIVLGYDVEMQEALKIKGEMLTACGNFKMAKEIFGIELEVPLKDGVTIDQFDYPKMDMLRKRLFALNSFITSNMSWQYKSISD